MEPYYFPLPYINIHTSINISSCHFNYIKKGCSRICEGHRASLRKITAGLEPVAFGQTISKVRVHTHTFLFCSCCKQPIFVSGPGCLGAYN
jgi:hypothetical protein